MNSTTLQTKSVSTLWSACNRLDAARHDDGDHRSSDQRSLVGPLQGRPPVDVRQPRGRLQPEAARTAVNAPLPEVYPTPTNNAHPTAHTTTPTTFARPTTIHQRDLLFSGRQSRLARKRHTRTRSQPTKPKRFRAPIQPIACKSVSDAARSLALVLLHTKGRYTSSPLPVQTMASTGHPRISGGAEATISAIC